MNTQKTSDRKTDHIQLAFDSQVAQTDSRFHYEPLLARHPNETDEFIGFELANKKMKAPIWVSSMTGGAEKAAVINRNLAKACHQFGMGMGLGSCRIILDNNTYLKDFQLRPIIGDELPFFANLGIAQLEELFMRGKQAAIKELIDKTETDGLIIHVNPMQEWLQPEGDRFLFSPLETIKRTLDFLDKPIIVKEVGQGMGPASLSALMQLPLDAIDFGAHGGTNFAMLELLRADDMIKDSYEPLAKMGHTANEMCDFANVLLDELGAKALCTKFIVSGGVHSFLDGYYYTHKLMTSAAYGQASAFLKHAQGDYETLEKYVQLQVNGLKMAMAYLRLK